LSNRNRAIFAEYIVAAILGAIKTSRIEWDEVDIRCNNKKIEVITSAYIQSWKQKAPSKINFKISKKRAWNAETNVSLSTPQYVADCYVFCIFNEKNPQTASMDILDLTKWEFLLDKNKNDYAPIDV
jgi:hypothetical protein